MQATCDSSNAEDSETILALYAPTTTRCDFCQVSFCGINVQSRCVVSSVESQSLHGLSDIQDLIQCPDVYECFDGDTVEVDYMIEYMTSHGRSPRRVYRQVRAGVTSVLTVLLRVILT